MIHYHGTPMTPTFDAARFFRGRHAMVSFATGRAQLALMAEVCQSFALDNGVWPRVALGSSGRYAQIGTASWWARDGGGVGVGLLRERRR